MSQDFFNINLTASKPSATLIMSAKAQALKAVGKDVINLAVGEPDYDTPDSIKEAAKKALDQGKTKYTAVEGVKELREAIAMKFARDNNITYSLDEIIVSSGAKQSLFLALQATINPGDQVIIPAPYWLSYVEMVNLLGGESVIVNTKASNNFKITAQELEAAITPKTKWFILNSPSNPTGEVYSEAELYALGEVLKRNPHLYLLSDDIYEEMLYEQTFYTMAQVVPELKERILTVNGASKAFSMTGWRLGYAAGPKELVKAMTLIQSHSTSHTSSISQYSIIEALKTRAPFLGQFKKLLQGRRDLFYEGLSKLPFLKLRKPPGAFYLWIDLSSLIEQSKGKINDGTDFSLYLLDKALVVGAPGEAFGAKNFIRFSYALDEKSLQEAVTRITKASYELIQ
jgi:aspartate aminotransferase